MDGYYTGISAINKKPFAHLIINSQGSAIGNNSEKCFSVWLSYPIQKIAYYFVA